MKIHKRKICVVTGTRADYGLLYWLLREIQADEELQLQLVVTGMHLSPEFGLTYKIIEDDGFNIDAKVEMLLSADSPVAITKSIGLGVIGFADLFAHLSPDIVVVLGDRFEILAVAQAALVARIPLAHLHGGESTEGQIDEGIRHAITKLSHLHFVAAEPYLKRVIQMGESPRRVFNVGAPGLDHLQHIEWMSRSELEQSLGMQLGAPLFIVTYHPVTLDTTSPAVAMRQVFTALEQFPEANIVFTYPNADTDGRVLIQLINEFVGAQGHRSKAFASLGQRRYLSLMKLADVVIGNSSSGLTEAPALHLPTVNIGDRQRGRLKATSVIDCNEQAAAITAAIHRALSAQFRHALTNVQSPYGQGGASAAIKTHLKNVRLDGLIRKEFYDL